MLKKIITLSLAVLLLCSLFFVLYSIPEIHAASTGQIYMIVGFWLTDDGGKTPNSYAKRIAAAHDAYGRPEWIEAGNWGSPHLTNAIIDYFHAHGIKVSCRIWSNYGNNPLNDILHSMAKPDDGSVDYQMSIGSHIDQIMVDECDPSKTSYYTSIYNYVHGLGKQMAVNVGGWNIPSTTPNFADRIGTEFCWYYFTQHEKSLIAQYPQKFQGLSNDWGYASGDAPYLPPNPPSPPLTEGRAVQDTLQAWNGGVYYFECRPGDTEGNTAHASFLPSWWEQYLQDLGSPLSTPDPTPTPAPIPTPTPTATPTPTPTPAPIPTPSPTSTLTFGHSTVGSSPDTEQFGYVDVTPFQAPQSGTITKLTFYCSIRSGTPKVKAVVYADSGGKPGALLGVGTEAAVPASLAWIDLPGLNIAVTSGTTYWIGFACGAKSGDSINMRSDNGPPYCVTASGSGYYANPPNTYPTPWTTAYQTSLYATGTARAS